MREIKSRMITDEDENRSEKDEEEEERNDTLTSEEIVENDRKSVVDDNKNENVEIIIAIIFTNLSMRQHLLPHFLSFMSKFCCILPLI